MVKGTRTNRHRFQWGKIEENVRGNKSVGIRAELKAGKTRSGYITACKCGERGCDRAHVDRNKKIGNTFAEYRKGGLIPSGIKRVRTRGGMDRSRGVGEGRIGKERTIVGARKIAAWRKWQRFRSRGTRRMSPSPAITGVHPQWDVEAAAREGTEGGHPVRRGVADRDGRHGPLDFMRDSI